MVESGVTKGQKGRGTRTPAGDAVRRYVVRNLGGAGAVLADDTGFLKRAPGRPACSGSIPAPPGGRRTARSGYSWRMTPGSGTR